MRLTWLLIALISFGLMFSLVPGQQTAGDAPLPPTYDVDVAVLSVVFGEGRFLGSEVQTPDLERGIRRGGLQEAARLLSREGQVGLVARSQIRAIEDNPVVLQLSQQDQIANPAGGGGATITSTSSMRFRISPSIGRGDRVEFSHDISFDMRVQRPDGESGRDRVQLNWAGAEFVARRDGLLIGRFTQLSPTGVLVEYIFVARITETVPQRAVD